MVVLAAVLIGAAGWWVESNREEEPEEDPTVETQASLQASGTLLEQAGSETASGGSTVAEVEITRTPAPSGEVPFDGPHVWRDLNASLSTGFHFGAPPFVDGQVEILYVPLDEEDYGLVGPIPAEAMILGRLQPETSGQASARIALPTDAAGEFLRGYLAFRAVRPGWLDGLVRGFLSRHRFPVGPHMASIQDLEIILEPGTEIPVRALGLPRDEERTSRMGRQIVQYRSLESEDAPWKDTRRNFRGQEDHLGACILIEKGKYQFRSFGPHGAGFIRSMALDPAQPPSEITILIEEYGLLSGRIHAPFPIDLSEGHVHAIHESLLDPSLPPQSQPDDHAFPPRLGSSEIRADGSFRIVGLAPGSYRLGWGGYPMPLDQQGVWFEAEPAPTGSRDLELEMPVSFLELRLLDGGGIVRPLFGKAGPHVMVRRMPRDGIGRPVDVEIRYHEDIRGFPVLGDDHYQVLVWSPDGGLVETEIRGPFPRGIFQVDLQVQDRPSGLLRWKGPEEEIAYVVLTEGLRQEVYSRDQRSHDDPMEVRLPPGRYLVRAMGRTTYGNHGEVGSERTPYGVEEQWVQVRSNEETDLVFDPPRCGSMEISVVGHGLADPDLPPHPLWSELVTGTPTSAWTRQQRPTFLLRSKEREETVVLEFQKYAGGSIYLEQMQFVPGQAGMEAIPLQVFLPGPYVLETRVFGYPLVTQDVTIEAGQRTLIEVVVGNP